MTSPWLTAVEAASYLRFLDAEGRPNVRALYHFLERHPIPVSRLGSRLRFHVDDIHALVVPRDQSHEAA